jgi:hypothetical protein
MLDWLKGLFRVPKPAGPPRRIRAFGPADSPIARDVVAADGDALRIDAREKQTVRLFEIADPGVEACLVAYRARMRSEALAGRAFLEMWCRLPGRGEFFSKGFAQSVKGTTDWASYEIPFFLKPGQRPDLIKLNLVVEGTGKIWMKEIEVLQTPLAF